MAANSIQIFGPKTPETLFRWMQERERIRQARAAGLPPPWTEDPVLREYSFTNVLREYDRTSIWIQRNITDKYVDHPQLWILLALARQINWPESLQVALDVLDSRDVRASKREINEADLYAVRCALDEYQAAGNKVYTGAYVVHADSNPATSGTWATKNQYIVEHVVGQLLGQEPRLGTIQTFTRWLAEFDAWGSFMSYEVGSDLRWARGWLDAASDIYQWANPGPGAHRGLNWIHGREIKSRVPEAQAIGEMRILLEKAQRREWDIEWPRPLEMRDVEHSLCELDKHQRVVHRLGRPRAKYKYKPVVEARELIDPILECTADNWPW